MNAPLHPEKVRLLCVDDEQNVLDGLALHVRRRYQMFGATSGDQALAILETEAPMAIVMSDMRMPGMNGATLLAKVRERHPAAVRMLLTGQADLSSAIDAVNQGQVFRFLTKPCPPPLLLSALDTAAEHYRLVTAERVLLEQTLHGSIKTLTDVLSLTNPIAFGRASRVKELSTELAETLDLSPTWQLEVAAMLSQLGCITLPSDVVEHLYYGRKLSEEDEALASRVPNVTEQLLANIPRLETVRAILNQHTKPYKPADAAHADPDAQHVLRAAAVLKVAVDFDTLEAQGNSASFAVDTMRGRGSAYDPDVLAALVGLRSRGVQRDEVREVPLTGLRVGMRLAEDLTLKNGALLVARGHELTSSSLERLRNFRNGTVKEPVRVVLPRKR